MDGLHLDNSELDSIRQKVASHLNKHRSNLLQHHKNAFHNAVREKDGSILPDVDEDFFTPEEQLGIVSLAVDKVPLPQRVSRHIGKVMDRRKKQRNSCLQNAPSELSLSKVNSRESSIQNWLDGDLDSQSIASTNSASARSTLLFNDVGRLERSGTSLTSISVGSTQNTPKYNVRRSILNQIKKIPQPLKRWSKTGRHTLLEQATEFEPAAYKLEVLYENQRGGVIFGFPRFSSQALLQGDPAAWCNIHFSDTNYNTYNHPLPDSSWSWVHSEWLVDMHGDVDEQGWKYATFFHAAGWHGTPQFWRSFVRRRRWIRLRFKPSAFSNMSSPAISSSSISVDNILTSPDTLHFDSLPPWSPSFIDPTYPLLSDEEFKHQMSRLSIQPQYYHEKNKIDIHDNIDMPDSQSLTDLNLQRLKKLLGKCLNDQDRLRLWRMWLSLSQQQQRISSSNTPESSANVHVREINRPTLWHDIITNRMKDVVATFEFQTSVREFLVLLCKTDKYYTSYLATILSNASLSYEKYFLTFPSDADFLRKIVTLV